MSDDINHKVINIFAQHNKNGGSLNGEKVKYYAGFHYVKLTKDSNGNKFNAEHLLKYSKICHYIVRVMRDINGETVLYNYDVPNDDLYRFLKSFEENTLDGTVIEIDKYLPDSLA